MKSFVSQFASNLVMMVARELQENKDKKRGDEKKVDREDEVEEEGKLIVNLVQVKLSRRNCPLRTCACFVHKFGLWP